MLFQRLRDELQMMKQYLVICPDANNQGLPWKCGLRTHFLENSNSYSIKDIINLQCGTLMDEVQIAVDLMRTHITETCKLCKAR